MLGALGWKVDPHLPTTKKAVVIAAPHTSNWDGPIMIAVSWVLGVRLHWIGKHTLFKPPFGRIVRALGGIPIDRRSPQGLVGQLQQAFTDADVLWVSVPPEGTRSKVEHWKSGFYAIAYGTDVPVLCGYLDFGKKIGGLGPAIEITGDVRADMDKIRAFYDGMVGKIPKYMGPIRLRAEEDNIWPPAERAEGPAQAAE